MMIEPNSPFSIVVHVEPNYLPEHSRPDDAEYAFSYTVSISNNGEESVQLLSRHWVITDANNRVREVSGDGVVGKQPHIGPGETYQYSSGAIIATSSGTMEGSYQMLSATGENFAAPIQPFGLIHPSALH